MGIDKAAYALAKNNEILNINQTGVNRINRGNYNYIQKKIIAPSGFSWDFETVNAYINLNGLVTTDFDVSDFEYVGDGKIYYVDVVNGLDTNDGLTLETALKSIYVARAKADVDIIMVASGFYEDFTGFSNKTDVNKSFSIKAIEGNDVTISTRRKLTWTKTEAKTNVYQSSRTLVASVYDFEANVYGDYTKLTSVASVDLCDATPGSYYYSTPNIYVHSLNSEVVSDTNICVFLDQYNLYNYGDYTVYAENIKFYGGKLGGVSIGAVTSATDNPLFVANGCEFKYNTGGAGAVEIVGADSICVDCVASSAVLDGFNYHKYGTRLPNAIEIRCTGYRNGIAQALNTNQGSTIHDGGKIIRVNCEYYETKGAPIHDTGTGTQSFNVGCVNHDSISAADNRDINFFSELGCEMWLAYCSGYGSKYAIATDTANIYMTGCEFLDGEIVSGGIQSYE